MGGSAILNIALGSVIPTENTDARNLHMLAYSDLTMDRFLMVREARFATKAAAPDETQPVTKIEVTKPVTKIDSVMTLETVTKIPVTKIGRGRPRLGDKPMTPAERMRLYRQRKAGP
jgi:hypothetical protein